MLFGSLLVFSLFIGAPANLVHASNDKPVVEIQQKSKTVTVQKSSRTFPAPYYFYNSGGYEGYLGLTNYYYRNGWYYATYSGTVYDRPPYPIPTKHSTFE